MILQDGGEIEEMERSGRNYGVWGSQIQVSFDAAEILPGSLHCVARRARMRREEKAGPLRSG
jgi:hypothetical protein